MENIKTYIAIIVSSLVATLLFEVYKDRLIPLLNSKLPFAESKGDLKK